MKILLTYGTNSSGTQAVSASISDALIAAGHKVVMKRAYEDGAGDFKHYDIIILGSCTWERFEGKQHLEGQLQQHMHVLTEQLTGQKYRKQKFAIFGLGDSSYTDFCAAANKLETFVHGIQGQIFFPTLRIDSYFFDLEKNRQRVEEWATQLVSAVGQK